ncbi:MAG: DnaA/Hda family protein [Pseudomonadota bacterium]|nr:DnaA/Hda family protein [Pseudomonadota bacterium]
MTDERVGGGEEFAAFQAALMLRMGGDVFSSWMADLRLEERSGDSVTFSTESKFKRDMLSQRFIVAMRDAWSEAVGPVRRVSIVTREKLSASAAKVSALMPKLIGLNQPAPASRGALLSDSASATAGANGRAAEERRVPALADLISPLDERSTFERFAVDDSNRLAYAAARQVFNPAASREIIYIYGPSGVGKTHLLHAIGNEWRATHGLGCAYLTYANLQTGCVSAIFSNGMLSLHKDLLAQDVVLIDDVHLLASSLRTQTEILNLINASLAAGRRLVIAGELAPLKLVERGVNERLADRLSGGLSVAMAQADEALRFSVLKKRLENAPAKCAISDEALAFIARKFTQSMREAIGALNHLLLAYSDREVVVGLDEAGQELKAHLADCRRSYTLDDCLAAAAQAFGVEEADLKGRAQRQTIVRVRHAFVYVAREVLRESFPRIAATLGRDHSTVMNGYQRALALLARDQKFRDGVAAIKAALGA